MKWLQEDVAPVRSQNSSFGNNLTYHNPDDRGPKLWLLVWLGGTSAIMDTKGNKAGNQRVTGLGAFVTVSVEFIKLIQKTVAASDLNISFVKKYVLKKTHILEATEG